MNTFYHWFFLLVNLLVLFLLSCQSSPQASQSEVTMLIEQERQEARDDSLELIAAYNRQAKISHQVQAAIETDAVASKADFDAADDPAIWVHPSQPEQSIIIGSNKKGGIHLYDLSGNEIRYFPVGDINNVDILSRFQLGEEQVVLIGGSNRSDQSIDIFVLDTDKKELIDVSANPLQVDATEIDDIYGFCFYHDQETNQSYAFANGKNGRVQQFELIPTENTLITIRKVRDIQIASQVEGMVADETYSSLYVGEEGQGIWKINAASTTDTSKVLIPMSTYSNPNISFDIEGLAIYEKGKTGYLIASSQGNFSYAVFERTGSNAYLGSFIIEAGEAIDGVEETDGIEASSLSLGESFPKGVLIAQDGFNHDGDSLQAQNFKLVDWQDIEAEILKF